MRIIESLILISLLPTVVMYFIHESRRPASLKYLPIVTAVLILLHLAIEGTRVQMMPACLLAFPSLVSTIFKLAMKRRRSLSEDRVSSQNYSRRFVRFGGVLVALIVYGFGILLPAFLPVFELPEPSGPFAVGTARLHYVDDTREETLTEAAGDSRQLIAKVWYPAEPASEHRRAPYMKDPPIYLDHFRLVETNAYADAPVSARQQSYPVLVFSHGYVGMVVQNTVLMEDLASHGYIVFSIGHPYEAMVTILPDGREIAMDKNRVNAAGEEMKSLPLDAIAAAGDSDEKRGLLKTFLASAKQLDESLRIWEKDTSFIIDEIEKLNSGAVSSVFRGKLSLDRLGIFGHSLGGAVAGQIATKDSRVKAGLQMYGVPFGDVIDRRFNKPFMYFSSEEHEPLSDPLLARAEDIIYRVTLKGAAHMDFTDLHLWFAKWAKASFLGTIDSNRAAKIVGVYTRAFFDKHLKGEATPLLDGSSAEFPEVVFTRRPLSD